MIELVPLIISISLCLAMGGLGGAMTAKSVKTWFPTLKKPALNPPSKVFGPVWTLLYILIGVAAWLVWREGKLVGVTGIVYLVQLVLNVAWSGIFFYARRIDLALADIILLWLLIVVMTFLFWNVSVWAGALLLPYLGWVSFATYLNAAIWKLNPQK